MREDEVAATAERRWAGAASSRSYRRARQELVDRSHCSPRSPEGQGARGRLKERSSTAHATRCEPRAADLTTYRRAANLLAVAHDCLVPGAFLSGVWVPLR